jgi:hypothetical protein
MTDAQRLEALEDAYYSGQRSVQLDGQRIEYQDMDEMWKAICRLKAEMSPAARPPIVSMRPTMYNRGRR